MHERRQRSQWPGFGQAAKWCPLDMGEEIFATARFPGSGKDFGDWRLEDGVGGGVGFDRIDFGSMRVRCVVANGRRLFRIERA